MKTSWYFSNRIKEPGLNLVGISATIPDLDLKGIRIYRPLCPAWELVKRLKRREITPSQYIAGYYEAVLNRLDPEKVYADLGCDAILLCWERPGHFCHRRLVAQWFYETMDLKISEL